MRAWTVAGGVIEQDGRILLVENLRRDGSTDWSTPGGVVDPGEELLEALTREVSEETGLRVAAWEGPVWTVSAVAPDLGWTLDVEVHRALGYDGQIAIDDPDGIVVDALWVDEVACRTRMAQAWVPSREPMLAWLSDPWDEVRQFRYRVQGTDRSDANIVRLE